MLDAHFPLNMDMNTSFLEDGLVSLRADLISAEKLLQESFSALTTRGENFLSSSSMENKDSHLIDSAHFLHNDEPATVETNLKSGSINFPSFLHQMDSFRINHNDVVFDTTSDGDQTDGVFETKCISNLDTNQTKVF